METKQCNYCYSDIPKAARKCKYCMEWQDGSSPMDHPTPELEEDDQSEKFSKLNVPFQLRLIGIFPGHYMVTVCIICSLIFAGITTYWIHLGEGKIYLLSYLSFIIQMMVSWAGLIWVFHLINDNYKNFIKISSLERSAADAKLSNHHGIIFSTKYSILTGIALGLIASIGDYVEGTPFISQNAKLTFACFEFVNMFFAGAAIYSMLCFAFFLRRFSYTPNKNILHLDKTRAIMNVGSLHLKVAILAIVPLFLGVMAKLFGNWDWTILVIVWYLSFAIAIIVYIYWPMMHIHRLLKSDIDCQVNIIQQKIHRILDGIDKDLSSEKFAEINELRKLEGSISSQNTWPFNLKSLSATFFAIIFPVLLILFEKILPMITNLPKD